MKTDIWRRPSKSNISRRGRKFSRLITVKMSLKLKMGIFNKRMNREGAIVGMLAGLLSTLIYIFWFKGWFFIPGTNSFTDADPLLGTVKSTSFGAIGAMVNFTVAFTVSKMTAAIPKEIEELVESVRVPRGAGAAQDH